MVEGGSDVVNGVAGDQGDFIVGGRNINDLVDSISGIRIVLDADSILLTFLTRHSLELFQIEDVLVGPF
jgi:hypothetical protein